MLYDNQFKSLVENALDFLNRSLMEIEDSPKLENPPNVSNEFRHKVSNEFRVKVSNEFRVKVSNEFRVKVSSGFRVKVSSAFRRPGTQRCT
ncbi:MAG: hypothetical protein SGJ05_10400 [bacterium]|nr:hypothetical protein [bacterium]